MAPLIVICGPTASGKSALALDLAECYQGEIICADSRTVYKGMDIGTAKPSREEQARVPHHLIDVVSPDERFTVYDFQQRAQEAIATIRARSHVPFLVGGTGLYIDSVVLDYRLDTDRAEERQALSERSVEELQVLIKAQHVSMPSNERNKRHLVQAIVSQGKPSISRKLPLENTIVVAITTNKETLEDRIEKRAQEMFEAGVVEEARGLAEIYGWESEAMSGNIYPILRGVIEGKISEEEAIQKVIIRDRQLAKRQITWLRRHDFVKWLNLEDAKTYIESLLG